MINLFYNYYVTENKQRTGELNFCFNKNITNKFVDKIYIIKESDLEVINNEKIITIDYFGIPTFEYVINLIKTYSKENDINIFLNSDCFLEENDMHFLTKIKKNDAWCLSRWDIKNIKNFKIEHYNHSCSQDCWIFQGIPKITNINFEFGSQGCDNVFANRAEKCGYKLFNPSKIFHVYHYHISTYKHKNDRVGGDYKFIEPSGEIKEHDTSPIIKQSPPINNSNITIINQQENIKANLPIDNTEKKNKELLEKWDREELIANLNEFNELYKLRPGIGKHGNMKSPYMFPVWYIIKKLKPQYIIESGVGKGQGTWFLEKACQESKVISIDTNPRIRVYSSLNASYLKTDFLNTDFSYLPKKETLVLFNDRQNFIERLKYIKTLGFKYLIILDNYPIQQGDYYSPKKILSNKKYVIDKNESKIYYKKNDNDLNYFKENVNVYQEMPPIFKINKTRWGDDWDENYPTPEPLLKIGDNDKFPIFFSESNEYTWTCYIELE